MKALSSPRSNRSAASLSLRADSGCFRSAVIRLCQGYGGQVDRGYRRMWRRVLAALIFLPVCWNAFGATDLPGRVPFDRYASILNNSPFAAPTMPDRLSGFLSRDLYIADMVRTPEGDTVTLRSVADPTFSMTIGFDHAKVIPLKK